MDLINHCSCPLKGVVFIVVEGDTILIAASVLSCLIVLATYWITAVRQQILLPSEESKPSHQNGHRPKKPRPSVKSRFRSRVRRQKKYRPKSPKPHSIRAKYFLYQCGSCQIDEKRCGHCASQEEIRNGVLPLKMKRSKGLEKASAEESYGRSCNLFHIVYTRTQSGCQPQHVYILLYSNHESEVEKASRLLKQAGVKILISKRSLTVRPPSTFSATLASKDATCSPSDIEHPIRHCEEKVFEKFEFSVRRAPVSNKDVLPDNISIDYQYRSCPHTESKSFSFSWATNTADIITCKMKQSESTCQSQGACS